VRWRLFAAVLTAGACHSAFASGQPALTAEPVKVTRFDDRVAGFSETSGFGEAVRLVVRDTSAWRRTWARLNAPFFPQPPLPQVDFSREMVLVAALGNRATGGFEIRIDSAVRRRDTIEVSIHWTSPGEGCLLAAVYTQPVDVAKIPAGPLPVLFREQNVRTSCRR
jgi:hypothetical protein